MLILTQQALVCSSLRSLFRLIFLLFLTSRLTSVKATPYTFLYSYYHNYCNSVHGRRHLYNIDTNPQINIVVCKEINSRKLLPPNTFVPNKVEETHWIPVEEIRSEVGSINKNS